MRSEDGLWSTCGHPVLKAAGDKGCIGTRVIATRRYSVVATLTDPTSWSIDKILEALDETPPERGELKIRLELPKFQRFVVWSDEQKAEVP